MQGHFLQYSHLLVARVGFGCKGSGCTWMAASGMSAQQGNRAARRIPGAPFGSTKSASSHTQHTTVHVAIMAIGLQLSSPVNQRFAASSTTHQHDRLTQRAHAREVSPGRARRRSSFSCSRRARPRAAPSILGAGNGCVESRRFEGRRGRPAEL